ncbi:hypothetical protein IV203_031186 [Nitzschia inconspicua]|uniref:Uncharacterized protein n=1 Tax=Nitzschia inconspicua TaxID=303405 RepID=A0A9K3Q2F2_9STRA|nr:hypothetical protein IV203_031186 [Nitzschia inconspicua]
MGGGISVELECDPLQPGVSKLKGTLVLFHHGKQVKQLTHPPFPRVTLQYRARCVDDRDKESHVALWETGGYVLEGARSTDPQHPIIVLNPGRNDFPFCFDIPESPTSPPQEFLNQAHCGRLCKYYQFQHILRAGCPPLTKDIQSFPRLLPKECDYRKRYLPRDNSGHNPILSAVTTADVLFDVASLAAS